MGCLSATWEVRGSAPAGVFTESAVSCSDNLLRCPFSAHTLGVCNGRGLASSQVPGGRRRLLSLVQYSHCVLHRGQNTLHLAPRTSWSVSSLHCRRRHRPSALRDPQGAQGVPGHVPRSRKSPPGAPGPAGRWVGRQAQALHGCSGSATNCQCPVGTITAQNPAECAVSTVTRCLATRLISWAGGGEPAGLENSP